MKDGAARKRRTASDSISPRTWGRGTRGTRGTGEAGGGGRGQQEGIRRRRGRDAHGGASRDQPAHLDQGRADPGRKEAYPGGGHWLRSYNRVPTGVHVPFFWSHLIFLSLARHWGKNGNQSVTTSLGDPLRFPFEREKKKIRRRFSISSSPPPPRREVPEPGPGASWLRSREETSYSPLPREGNLSKAI